VNSDSNPSEAGYSWLVNAYSLLVIPNWHVSSVARSGVQRSRVEAGQHFEIYPPVYQPAETLGGRLEFALKYDGVNLEILDALFEKLDQQELVDYGLDEQGRMTVHNETARHYRYLDMTVQTEALFRFIETVVTKDLLEELRFLKNYDTAKRAIQEIVDLPDRLVDLFIRFCLQNQGRLSARKRTTRFATLTEDEVLRMEKALSDAYFADGDS